jgi:prolyl-tRNA editing enzyme YbaK/EbsC (Cys-tRNA(Pro) deacylase)
MAAGPEAKAESKGSVARVRETLARLGLEIEIKEFDASTRTSADAAVAIGCTVAQIAKSVIFRARNANQPVLVIASGINRVDENKLEAAIGDKIGRADVIDQDLDQYDEIWAAAGSPNAVFRLTPADLRRLTGGQVIAVK